MCSEIPLLANNARLVGFPVGIRKERHRASLEPAKGISSGMWEETKGQTRKSHCGRHAVDKQKTSALEAGYQLGGYGEAGYQLGGYSLQSVLWSQNENLVCAR